MTTAHVNGIDVYFERSGAGPPLLFFNGSGATLQTTSPLIDPYRARFDVLVHDQRGLGRTDIPPGPYTMADYAADARALMDHVGWSTCRVVGISFGGMVAQEFAVTLPERVERLVLAVTSPGGPESSSYPLHELESLDEASRAARYPTLLDTRFTPEYIAEHADVQALVAMMATRTASTKSDDARRGEHEQLMARSTHDVRDRLGRIDCPTLVVAGRYDGIAPVGNSEAIASRIPGAELRVYQGGHIVFIQEPQVTGEMIDFLAQA